MRSPGAHKIAQKNDVESIAQSGVFAHQTQQPGEKSAAGNAEKRHEDIKYRRIILLERGSAKILQIGP